MSQAYNLSPVILASIGSFDKIDWENLTEKNITECNDKGKTLLHYAAEHSIWHYLPKQLQDKKYWKPTLDGTTIYMFAAESTTMGWIDKNDLTEEEILKKNKAFESILTIATQCGNLDKLPIESLTQKVLKETHKIKDLNIHFIAKERWIKSLPKNTLTEELLSTKGNEGMSVYHILAETGQLRHLPENSLTPTAFTLKDNVGETPLSLMLSLGKESTNIIPKELLTPEIMFKKDGREAPIHSWVKGELWMEIPEHLITKESLKLKGPKKSLLYNLISQYTRNATWLYKTDNETPKMLKIIKKSLSLSNENEMLSIKNEIETPEGENTYPNGIKKASTLIKEELAKREVIRQLNKHEKEIELD